MNWILWLFVLLTCIVALAWAKKYRLSVWLFVIFLILASIIFALDITEALTIQL